MKKLLRILIYTVILVVLLIVLHLKTSPVMTDSDKSKVTSPGVYTSMKFDDIKKLIPQRIDYIKEKSTFLEPYDKAKLDFISGKIPGSTGEEMISLMLSIPNGEKGYYRMEPANKPAPLSAFQFEQGMTAWYWIY